MTQYKNKTIFNSVCDKCGKKIHAGEYLTLEYFDKYNLPLTVLEAYQLLQRKEKIKTLITCRAKDHS